MSNFDPGEKLVLSRVEDWSVENLEPDALARLKRRVGKQVTFLAEDEHGFVEVEFTATEKARRQS